MCDPWSKQAENGQEATDIRLLVFCLWIFTCSQMKILDSFKLKVCRRQFQIPCKWMEFTKILENNVRKRRNWSSRAISPFPTVFLKDLNCRHVKTWACFQWCSDHYNLLLFPHNLFKSSSFSIENIVEGTLFTILKTIKN